jgi:hypothetical protein
MLDDMQKEEQKSLIKEAFKEWLDEKAAQFGKWTFKYVSTAIVGAMLYYLVSNGFIGK